ncbi:MAG: lysylphosphatidylglycerol synthase transmembrane domain-containing protein [Planctomycetia bacterium]
METPSLDIGRRRVWHRVIRAAAWLAVGAAVGLVAWRLFTDPVIRGLSPRSFHWLSLALATVIGILGQLLYSSRWYWLLRVLQAPFTWVEAVSAGLMAQLLGSVAIGSAGSDVYRGIATGRSRAGHRVGIVASILADRVVGLYSLLCLAALAATFTPGSGRWQGVRAASLPVLWTAVIVGGGCILAGLFFNLGLALAWTRHFPPVHRLVVPMLAAVERFRSRPGVIFLGIASGMVVHALSATGLWLLARGLGLPHPTLAEHCLIVPLAMCTGLVPLPMAGLGAMELVMDGLYQMAVPDAAGAGLVVALVGRITGLAVNAILAAVFVSLSRALDSISTGKDVFISHGSGGST